MGWLNYQSEALETTAFISGSTLVFRKTSGEIQSLVAGDPGRNDHFSSTNCLEGLVVSAISVFLKCKIFRFGNLVLKESFNADLFCTIHPSTCSS